MEQHPFFDLWLHSTQELSKIFNQRVIDRETLHSWPLSCVQRITLSDGSKRIYKSQLRATTVEPEFYSTVQDTSKQNIQELCHYLPYAQCVGTYKNSIGMIFEMIDSPQVDDLCHSTSQIIQYGDCLLALLLQFPPELPVYTDISNVEKWRVYVDDTLDLLMNLIVQEKFHQTNLMDVEKLKTWSESNSVMDLIQTQMVLNHGDLGGDNIFLTPQGYKIIDWQRPIRGPAGLDYVTYLFAMGLDPLQYTPLTLNEINWFVHLRWFVECKSQWFTAGESYDRQVGELTHLVLQ